jgi:hypothetical protein
LLGFCSAAVEDAAVEAACAVGREVLRIGLFADMMSFEFE